MLSEDRARIAFKLAQLTIDELEEISRFIDDLLSKRDRVEAERPIKGDNSR